MIDYFSIDSRSFRYDGGCEWSNRGGGGGVLPYVCILGMCRARVRSISFSQISTQKKPFRSITILHFWADFAVPETIIFKISLISTRSSPPTAGSARTQSVRQHRGLTRRAWQFRRVPFSRSKWIKLVPEPHIFKLKTAQARSGAPHFQAQNGSSSFRSPAFSRSTGNSFRSPCPFFTLPRHIPTKIWGEYPPPPRVEPFYHEHDIIILIHAPPELLKLLF